MEYDIHPSDTSFIAAVIRFTMGRGKLEEGDLEGFLEAHQYTLKTDFCVAQEYINHVLEEIEGFSKE